MGRPPDFLASPTAEIRPMLAAASRGDAEARRYFASVFPPTALCVLCDGEIGSEGTSFVHPDPTAPGMTLLMPCCAKCVALPAKDRRAAELRMARAMWPHIRWRPTRGNDPAYLRAGGPKGRT
jgi:hypothetical protein